MFRYNKTIIREPTVCASLKLQYWRQLKYFVIEMFVRLAAYYSVLLVCLSCTVQSEQKKKQFDFSRSRFLKPVRP
jgi:hypothetical protein